MFFALVLALAKSLKQICICNEQCSPLCPNNRLILTESKSNIINHYLKSQIQNEEKIELNFYSKQKNVIFNIDDILFINKNVSLKTLPDSKLINVNYNSKIISIKPNQQMFLPIMMKPALLEDPDTPPIPISVGLAQMDHNGTIKCHGGSLNINNIQNLNCEYNDLESSSAYHCGYQCWSTDGSAVFNFSFKGVKFAIYGTVSNDHGKFDAIIDNMETVEIDSYNDERHDYQILFTSQEMDYDEHTVEIKGKGNLFELYKLVFLAIDES